MAATPEEQQAADQAAAANLAAEQAREREARLEADRQASDKWYNAHQNNPAESGVNPGEDYYQGRETPLTKGRIRLEAEAARSRAEAEWNRTHPDAGTNPYRGDSVSKLVENREAPYQNSEYFQSLNQKYAWQHTSNVSTAGILVNGEYIAGVNRGMKFTTTAQDVEVMQAKIAAQNAALTTKTNLPAGFNGENPIIVPANLSRGLFTDLLQNIFGRAINNYLSLGNYTTGRTDTLVDYNPGGSRREGNLYGTDATAYTVIDAVYLGKGDKPLYDLTPGTASYRFSRDEFGQVLRGGNFSPQESAAGVAVNPKMGSGDYRYVGEYQYNTGEIVSRYYEANVGSFIDIGEAGAAGRHEEIVRAGGGPGSYSQTKMPTYDVSSAAIPLQKLNILDVAAQTIGGALWGIKSDSSAMAGVPTYNQKLGEYNIHLARNTQLVDQYIAAGGGSGTFAGSPEKYKELTNMYSRIVADQNSLRKEAEYLPVYGKWYEQTQSDRQKAEYSGSMASMITLPILEAGHYMSTGARTGMWGSSWNPNDANYRELHLTPGIDDIKVSVARGAQNFGASAELSAFAQGGVEAVAFPAMMFLDFGMQGIIPGTEWLLRNPGKFASLAVPVGGTAIEEMVMAPVKDPWGQAPIMATMIVGNRWMPLRGSIDMVPTGEMYLKPRFGAFGEGVSKLTGRITGLEMPESSIPMEQLTLPQRMMTWGQHVPAEQMAPRLSLRFDPVPMLHGSGMLPIEVTGSRLDVRDVMGINIKPMGSSWISPKYSVKSSNLEMPEIETVSNIEITRTKPPTIHELSRYEAPEVNWLEPSTLVRPSSRIGAGRAYSQMLWEFAQASPLWLEFGRPRAMAQFIEHPSFTPAGNYAALGTSMMLTSLTERARLEKQMSGDYSVRGLQEVGADLRELGIARYEEGIYPGRHAFESSTVSAMNIGTDATTALRIYKLELQELTRIFSGKRVERINSPYIEAKTIQGGLIPKGYEKDFLDILKTTDREAYLTGTYAMSLQSYYKRVEVPEIDIISDYHAALGSRYADFYNKMYPAEAGQLNVKLEFSPEATSVWTRQVLKVTDNVPEYGTKFEKRLDIHSQKYGMGWEEYGAKHSYRDVIEIDGIRMMPLEALAGRKLSTIMAYSPSETTGELLIGAKEGKWKNLADTYAVLKSRELATYEMAGGRLSGELEAFNENLFAARTTEGTLQGFELNPLATRARAQIRSTAAALNEMWGFTAEGVENTYSVSQAGRDIATERFYMESKTGTTKGQLFPEYAATFSQGAYYKAPLSPLLHGRTIYKNWSESWLGRAQQTFQNYAGIPLSLIPLKLQSRDIQKGAAYDLDMVVMPKYGILGGKLTERSVLHATQLQYQSPRLGLQSYLTRTFGIVGEGAAQASEGVIPLATRITKRSGAQFEGYAPGGKLVGDAVAGGEVFGISIRDMLPRKHPTETVETLGVVKAAAMPAREARMATGLGTAESWMFFGKSDFGIHFRENALVADLIPDIRLPDTQVSSVFHRGTGVSAVVREMMTGGSQRRLLEEAMELGESPTGYEGLTVGYTPLGQGLSITEKGVHIADTSAITEPLLREFTRLESVHANAEFERLLPQTGILPPSRSALDIARFDRELSAYASEPGHELLGVQLQRMRHTSGVYDYLTGMEESMRRAVRAEATGVRGLYDVVHNVDTVPQGMETRIIDIMRKHDLRAQGTMTNLAFQEYGLVRAGDLDLAAKTQAAADAAAVELMQIYRDATKRGSVPNPLVPGEMITADYYTTVRGENFIIQGYSEHPISLDKTVNILDTTKSKAAGTPQDKAFSVHVEEFGEDITWGLRSALNPARPSDIRIDGVRFQSLSEQLMNKTTTPMYFSFTESGQFYLGTKPIKSPRFGKDVGDVIGDLTNRYRQMSERGGGWTGYNSDAVMRNVVNIEKYAISPLHPSVQAYAEGVYTSSGEVFGQSIAEYGKRLSKYPSAGSVHPVPVTRVQLPVISRTIRMGETISNLTNMYASSRPIVYGAAAMVGAAIVAPYVMDYLGVSDDKQKSVLEMSTFAMAGVISTRGKGNFALETGKGRVKLYNVEQESIVTSSIKGLDFAMAGETARSSRSLNYQKFQMAPVRETAIYRMTAAVPRGYARVAMVPSYGTVVAYNKSVAYPAYTKIANYPNYSVTRGYSIYPEINDYPIYPKAPSLISYPDYVQSPGYPELPNYPELPKLPGTVRMIETPRPPKLPGMGGLNIPATKLVFYQEPKGRRPRKKRKQKANEWYIWNPVPTMETVFGTQLNIKTVLPKAESSMPRMQQVKMPKYKMPKMKF